MAVVRWFSARNETQRVMKTLKFTSRLFAVDEPKSSQQFFAKRWMSESVKKGRIKIVTSVLTINVTINKRSARRATKTSHRATIVRSRASCVVGVCGRSYTHTHLYTQFVFIRIVLFLFRLAYRILVIKTYEEIFVCVNTFVHSTHAYKQRRRDYAQPTISLWFSCVRAVPIVRVEQYNDFEKRTTQSNSDSHSFVVEAIL